MNRSEDDFEHIRRCRDGEASAEELAALETRLRTDAVFREQYVRYMNLDEALGMAVSALAPASEPARTRSALPWTQGPWRWTRPVGVGLLAGLLSATVTWAVALPWFADARVTIRTILGESFETAIAATLPGLPSDCGAWSGDEAVVVTAEQGVTPRNGRRMLRFLSASYAGDYSPRNQWSDVYRLVDVRGLARDDHERARLFASFAQTPVEAGEQYACSVEAIALEHNPGPPPLPLALPRTLERGSVAGAHTLPLTGDRAWREVSVEVPISPKTQFVLLHVAATRTSPAVETGPVRFSGHYMDDVKLELVSRR